MVTTGVSVSNGAEKVRLLDRAEEHFLRSIVDAKTAFPEDIHSHNRIHLVAEGLLKIREIFRQNGKGLDTNRAKNNEGRTTSRVWTLEFERFTLRVVQPTQECARFSGPQHLGRPRCLPGNELLDIAN